MTVRDPGTARDRFARVKVPGILPRFVSLGDGNTFVPLEQVIATHLDKLFPGMDVVEAHPFRVTRDAEIELAEDEADDLLVAVEQELRRQRFGVVVRLEVASTMPDHVVRLLQRELEVEDDALVTVEGPLNLGDLMGLVSALDRPELADEPWVGTTQPRLLGTEEDSVNLFATLREGDLLVHHPYDAFSTSVQRFIEQAAEDPHVLAIKQTLYRTDGDSPIVTALIQAAESGKQVVVLVEVKARGDEASNIGWARALERAGCHVAYGLVGLKTHSKTALVVRREHGGIRRYVHIGTGNYNAKTARLYTDLGLLSCDEDLGADLTELFNSLTGYARGARYRKILVAPNFLRQGVIELIERRRRAALQPPPGPHHPADELPGRRGLHPRPVRRLPGRGADRPDRPGHLPAAAGGAGGEREHPGALDRRPLPGAQPHLELRQRQRREYYIGSADLMPRNLDLRVECVTPVTDPDLTGRLQEVLDVMLADNVQAWELSEDGSWHRSQPAEGERRVATHKRVRELALRRGVEARAGAKADSR